MLPLTLLARTLLLLLALVPAPIESVSGPHIADLNVLLPPRMTNPVEYRLQGSDGCFSWSWDHHDILSVIPEYNDSSLCSTSARLISIAPYSGRKETAVYASDFLRGTVIRCEVFIDKISRIKIFHHSVKLDLDSLATLHVRAFDEEENIFSSLVGLQFMWQLTPKPIEAVRTIHHLVHVPLRDTPLSDCGGFSGDLSTQIKLENSGIGSDLYVVRGTEIGHEVVSVHLLEPQLEHITDQIDLTVAEAMSLDPPSPIFVIIGASVQYSLRVIRHNTPQVIDLPSPYHRWYVLNSSVARVDSMMGLAHALNFGITNVIVEDARVAGHLQMSSMHVVLPDKLHLYLVPVTISCDPVEGTKSTPSTVLWYVVAGRQYVVYMKVFSRGPGAQEIYITGTDDVKLQYNHSSYWDVFPLPNGIAAKHGWRCSRLIKATSQGLGSLAASLSYHSGNAEKTEVLKIVQDVMVCDQVKIRMRETNEYSRTIHLPWARGVYQEVKLTAVGGCAKSSKDYSWFSFNVAVASVSDAGLVRVNSPGQAIIRVVSVFDSINCDEVVIEVSIPTSMVLQTFPVEVVVGKQVQATLTMKTFNGNDFYSCDALSSFVRWEVHAGSESFKIVNTVRDMQAFDNLWNVEDSKSLYSPPCSWTYLIASGAGRAMLHATLPVDRKGSDHSSDGPIIINASSLIAAYLPLVIHQAGSGNRFGGYWADLAGVQSAFKDPVLAGLDELYLVPGTGLEVVLLGGPEPWGQGFEFVETVEIFTEGHKLYKDGVLVNQAPTGGGKFYRIFCQKVGNFTLVFSRGHLAGEGHPLPVVENVELPLICSFPSSVVVIANEPVSRADLIWAAYQADRGPGKVRKSPITVANGCTIRIAAVGIHNSGRAFANSSSLILRWELSACDDLAYWNDTGSSESSESAWERFLVLQNATGLCIVRSTVIGFSDVSTGDVFEKVSLPLESSKSVLTDAVQLQLVSSLRIIPETVLMFFDPDAKVNLSITGGTCFLDPAVNDTQVVQVIRLPPSMQCSTLILGARGLGTALITVRDMGLVPPIAASALVQVADLDWIKIVSQEEISLMEGTTKSIDILAGIYDGNVFDSSQYAYMNIHVHLMDGVLELVDEDGFPRPSAGEIRLPNFVIRAVHLGVTTLHVSARRQSGHEILSQVIKVEVYSPLRIHPEDIYLSPGASYVLTVEGGPRIGVVVEYGTVDNMIATIHRSSGKLSAVSTGNTTVSAKVYRNGGKVICEARGRVKVRIPSSMILNLQSEQLSVGREMPVFISSSEGNLFSFYELCKNYKWTIEDEQVLRFQMAGSSRNDDVYEVPFSGAEDKYFPNYSNGNDLGFINTLYGRSAGRTTVAVSLTCDFISSGPSHTISYNASKSVVVISDPPLALGETITWLLPPFYATSKLLPGSSESYGKWDSHSQKRSIIYSLLRLGGEIPQHDAIAIDGSRIKTREGNSLGCIQAKDRATGKAVIASCVRVAEVAQIRVNTKEFPFHVAELGIGAKLELVINYTDALGNPFYEAYGVVPLDIETNYPDIVSIQNSKGGSRIRDSNGEVHIQAIHHGRALVRISINNNPQKADYILVSVGARLSPQNPFLHVGHYRNFSITGEGLNDVASGQWVSANVSVLSIDRLSGEAHAVGEGTTQVIFEGLNFKLRTPVKVLRVASVSVDAPVETLTNVPFPMKGYNFSIRFSDSYNDKFEANGSSKGLQYDCKVDPPFVGYAKPWTDLDTGHSFCLFFPYSPEYLARSMPKLMAMRPELKSSGSEGFMYISVIASLRGAPQIMGSANAPFVGGFSILEIKKLNLTPNSNKSFITVIGNTDVEINWHAKDLMLIRPFRRDDMGIGGQAEFEVRVLQGQSFVDKIIITLPATGHREEIDVNYETGERTTSSIMGNFVWAAILGSVVLILTVLIYIWLLDRPNRSRQLVPATSATAGPTTRNLSPPGNIQHSPQTPQPFVEYVRRTIDETPYYKRAGRRRFDPQYTY
ncbi:embryo defective 3012 isoform X2 [Tasmannia lanceolata]|uniref:embryo defective 3012 isoform X2 n=1 Tax=Tasmannia lanceolata TaxID=3420 RepID=UPI00406369F0